MTVLSFNDGKLLVPVVPAISSAEMVENMRSALTRGLPELRYIKTHGNTLAVASGGPSLHDTFERLEGHVGAVNGSLGFLLDRGLVPHFCGVMDSHPRMADVVAADRRVIYIVASNCHPSLFDKLIAAGCRVHVWHATPDALGTTEGDKLLLAKYEDPLRIGGGCTIGLRWLSLGYVMGYRKFHLHGLDSSFKGRTTHAYDDRRTGDWVDGSSIEINGRATSLNFLAQVTSFGRILDHVPPEPIEIDVFGDGLLQDCCRAWDRSEPAADAFARMLGQRSASEIKADERAHEILSRLPAGEVFGAEIGVFGGALSKRLLQRPDLNLWMIDSWEGDGAAYRDKRDWHATLSQDQQDAYYWAAVSGTGAMRDRRRILRRRSLDAVKEFTDGSLDFVFLDADHSGEALAADLEAWKPKIKSGGLICGHDYGNPLFPEVAPAVLEFGCVWATKIETGADYTWFMQCR